MKKTVEEQEAVIRKKMYAPLAELLVTQQAEELEAKEGLLIPKEQYIKSHSPLFEEALDKHFKKIEKRIQKAGELIHAELKLLSEAEKAPYEKDILHGLKTINLLATDPSAIENKMALFTANTLQDFLEMSDKTLLWIYSIGHRFIEEKKGEDAYAIFHMLVSSNSLVSDYWIALGFAKNLVGEELDALNSFSMASLLNPESPISRYQSAKIYLNMNQLDDALAEVEALEEIIETQNLDQLKASTQTIKNQIVQQKNFS
jgi:tetratricopeptide (TPR) repeat protein